MSGQDNDERHHHLEGAHNEDVHLDADATCVIDPSVVAAVAASLNTAAPRLGTGSATVTTTLPTARYDALSGEVVDAVLWHSETSDSDDLQPPMRSNVFGLVLAMVVLIGSVLCVGVASCYAAVPHVGG